MANTDYRGETMYGTCPHCHKPYPHLTGLNYCECKKTDTGIELLGLGGLLGDLGLGLQQPSIHGKIVYENDEVNERLRNREWTDQEKLDIIKVNARHEAHALEMKKIYNQPSFVGILIKLYREIRNSKLFIKLGKDYRDEGNIQKEDELV